MNSIKQVISKLKTEYATNANAKTTLVDAFIVYCIATGVVQLIYMVFVGNFPFNSFLSGFLCHLGLFALATSLRIQLTIPGEFRNVSPEKAFGDFMFGAIVLFFVVFSFLG